MDTREKHRQIIHQVLQAYIDPILSQPDDGIATHFIKDDDGGHYQLMHIGWGRGERYTFGSFVHLDLKADGKIWVQHDGTDMEYGIPGELVAAGVPKSSIILGYLPPEYRIHTLYAVE